MTEYSYLVSTKLEVAARQVLLSTFKAAASNLESQDLFVMLFMVQTATNKLK